MTQRLTQSFFARPAQVAAPALLGQRLVRYWQGQRLSGLIVETEAYCDYTEPDLACHGDRANHGRPTPRTAVMFGPAGYAYVYFTYGIHWLFNVVTGQPGRASAVLIRALAPEEGVPTMHTNRQGRPFSQLTNGPAKLTQALAIDQSVNQANLCQPDGVVWLEAAAPPPPEQVARGPRIGLGKTPEPWLSMPWRYWIRDHPFVSQ